jgi:hypothetical protein
MSKILLFLGLIFLGVIANSKPYQVKRDRGAVTTGAAQEDPFAFLNTLRNSKPNEIQAQADGVIGLLSGYLTAPENQAYIKNITQRAHNVLRNVNMRPVRDSAVIIVDHVFTSLISLQSSLVSKLSTLNSSKDPINDLKSLLGEMALEVEGHFDAINNTAQAEFDQFRQRYARWLNHEQKETIADIQLILGYLVGEVRGVFLLIILFIYLYKLNYSFFKYRKLASN